MKNWKPFPKQELALSFSHKVVFEILFGGARGPGKTDAGMVWLLGEEYEKNKLYIQHPLYRALVLRKNYEDLNDWLDRARIMYRRSGVKITGKPATIEFPSGAKFRCGHLKDSSSYEKYLGHEYQRILVEELTEIPEEKYYVQILGSCRTTISELGCQVFCTTNPGGKGHSWVRSRFVQPPPQKTKYLGHKQGHRVFSVDGSRPRIFIPATVEDNPEILKDPGYIQYLESIKQTDSSLYRAWRHGDWSVFAGQVFNEFRPYKHVIDPITPSPELRHVIWIDWGYSRKSAFAAYASAIKQETNQLGDKYNRVITYKEWWGNQTSPQEWAKRIYEYMNKNDINPSISISDPAMHSTQQSGDVSIAKMMTNKWKELHNKNWCRLVKGSNSGRNSRVNRVGMMHNWLSDGPDGLPYWVITKNCTNLIKTLPELAHDENLVEAYDTDQNDHGADACSYGLEKVKFISVEPGNIPVAKEKKRVPRRSDGSVIINPSKMFQDLRNA
jgi:hypothetical protein